MSKNHSFSCTIYLFNVISYEFHTKYIKNLCFECTHTSYVCVCSSSLGLDNLMDFNLSHAFKFWHMHAHPTRSLQRRGCQEVVWLGKGWRLGRSWGPLGLGLEPVLMMLPRGELSKVSSAMRRKRRNRKNATLVGRKVFRVHMSIDEWYYFVQL